MASDQSYVLVVEFEGEYTSEAAAYDPDVAGTDAGAGEALKALEKRIRTMVYSAQNTVVKVKSLTRS